MASAEAIDNLLIAQHPQEKKEASAASAMLRCGEHAGVGNSYSFGWECSVGAGGVTRTQGQGDRPDLAISGIRDSRLFPG